MEEALQQIGAHFASFGSGALPCIQHVDFRLFIFVRGAKTWWLCVCELCKNNLTVQCIRENKEQLNHWNTNHNWPANSVVIVLLGAPAIRYNDNGLILIYFQITYSVVCRSGCDVVSPAQASNVTYVIDGIRCLGNGILKTDQWAEWMCFQIGR